MIKLRIKEVRKSRRMTQRELAMKSGISQSYISELENGTGSSPTLDSIESICVALEVCPLDIIECNCKYSKPK